jgi:hypothetical protein
MNAPFDRAQVIALPSMPAEFEVLAPPPLLLPGESLEQYHLTRQAILSEIAPRSAIEWLLVIDVRVHLAATAQLPESRRPKRTRLQPTHDDAKLFRVNPTSLVTTREAR